MSELAQESMELSDTNSTVLSEEQIAELQELVDLNWKIVDNHHLERVYQMANFQEGLDFVNKAGAIAEECNHHPDFFLSFKQVKLKIFDHKANGLTRRDFILAARIEDAS